LVKSSLKDYDSLRPREGRGLYLSGRGRGSCRRRQGLVDGIELAAWSVRGADRVRTAKPLTETLVDVGAVAVI
jgi:hypothetical protein